MSRILVVATAGAGGDLQPLLAVVANLRARSHAVTLVGDAAVRDASAGLGVDVEILPAELDLGPRLVAAIRDAMSASQGDVVAAGPLVEASMAQWAVEVAEPVRDVVDRVAPGVVLTSLFGVEVLAAVPATCPWAVVNSTFYVGPNPPRPIQLDVAARAVPLLARYARLLERADLVLHATDQVFDLGFTGLPERHHYVGPLGIWEAPGAPPGYLLDPGDPWVLVAISSQLQDDVALAEMAVAALADQPVRVMVTVGPGHDPALVAGAATNVHVERTVPHLAVLERAVLLVSHAGHGSVMKALWSGTPMVLVPWGRDQPGVSARAEALGVAAVVPRADATVATLSAAVDRVLADEGMHQRCAAHAMRLQAGDSPGRAADLVEALLRAGAH